MKPEDKVLACKFNWRGQVTLCESFLEALKKKVESVISLMSGRSPIAIFAVTVEVFYNKLGICCDRKTGSISDYIFFGDIRIKDKNDVQIIGESWELTYNLERKRFFGKIFEISVSRSLYLKHFDEQFYDLLKQAIFSEEMLTLARKKIILI